MQKTVLRFGAVLCVVAALTVVMLGVIETIGGGSVTVTAEGLTVVVDAGHGGFDGGAVGVAGTVEAGLNLAVAKKLEAALASHGVVVLMTRTDENAVGDTKQADMQQRKKLLSDARADAVVSVHMNTFGDAGVSGAMAYYMQGSAEGQALAQQVIDAVTAATGQKRRQANPGDYFVVRECSAPAVLVECGFLSNAAEEALLGSESYQQILADAIAEGVLAYFDARGQ